MSFRKRNAAVSQPGSSGQRSTAAETAPPAGVRPSPIDGRPTTSTGTRSLDSLLAGHAGLALGNSLLVEERGTTDFGGVLLRYYASEGIVQGHHVHVLGVHEAWRRELPGLSEEKTSSRSEEKQTSDDKMKIAWRYERLGEFGAGARDRPQATSTSSTTQPIFCHDFDLSKRLTLPSSANLTCIPLSTHQPLSFTAPDPSISPFTPFITHLTSHLAASPTAIHRILIPSLLSPALYPPHASHPAHILQFLHVLRSLLRRHPANLTAMVTLPLTLFPRSAGLTRWIELLSDGVLELAPFPAAAVILRADPKMVEDPSQGLLRILRLPIFHEKGGGGGGAGEEDLAFSLSRRRGVVVRPFTLPPVEGDGEEEGGNGGGGKATKIDIEF